MDSVSKAKLENTLIKHQTIIDDYRNYAQNELIKTQNTIDINLRNFVVEKLKKYCAEKNMACVADYKSVLYCKDCGDFTDDFVEYLKTKLE